LNDFLFNVCLAFRYVVISYLCSSFNEESTVTLLEGTYGTYCTLGNVRTYFNVPYFYGTLNVLCQILSRCVTQQLAKRENNATMHTANQQF